MAVTFAAITDSDAVDVNFVTSVTISHTPGSGTDRATGVWVHFHGDPVGTTLSTLTQGGNAMTAETSETSQANVTTYFRWRVNPDSGAANIVATASGSTDALMVIAKTNDGCDQIDPIDATAVVGGEGGTGTDTIASATGRLVDACVSLYREDEGVVTVGGGQTSRANYLANEIPICQALGEEAGAASVVSDFGEMIFSGPENSAWSMITVSWAEAAGAGGLEIPIAYHHYRQQWSN